MGRLDALCLRNLYDDSACSFFGVFLIMSEALRALSMPTHPRNPGLWINWVLKPLKYPYE